MGPRGDLEISYRFDASRKHVSRILRLPKGREVSTVLSLDRHNCSSSNARLAFDCTYLKMQKGSSFRSGGRTIRAADLFCGCGGLSLGLMEACIGTGLRFIPVCALDWNSDVLDVYRCNFPQAGIYNSDIRTLLDGDIGSRPTTSERTFLRNLQSIDFVVAGPPCQGNSDLNNRTRRKDERNLLYERVARFAELVRPTHVLIENVPAVVHGDHETVKRSVEALVASGYHVETGVVNLADIGVPQKRKRHLVIASRIWVPSLAEVMQKHRVDTVRTVRWAIGDLENESQNSIYTRPSTQSPENRERILFLQDNDIYDLPDALRPPCHRYKHHTYKSMYGRMKYDEPCQTITSGFTSPGQGRYIHPTQARTLTPHEAARLQFLPDHFDFSLVRTRSALTSMIANAVPMNLSYVLSLELLAASKVV